MNILIIAFIINFFSTWYFGWNMYPQSDLEHSSDHLCFMLATIGFAQIMWRKDMKKMKEKEEKNA